VTPHHGAVDFDMMISYWDDDVATMTRTTDAAYWIDPAASHDKLGYWDWPIVSFYFEEEDELVQEELQESPACSVTENDSYWLF
jgi:hypothetical protein